MRLMHESNDHPPIQQIFAQIQDQKDAVFLDSSLPNQLGRFSIIGLAPYLKLVQGENFTVNGEIIYTDLTTWVKDYLRTHQETNDTTLPLISGAIGYFSYDYGRKKEQVQTRHPKELDIPDCILVFYDNFIIEDHQEHRLYLIANDHGIIPSVRPSVWKTSAPSSFAAAIHALIFSYCSLLTTHPTLLCTS